MGFDHRFTHAICRQPPMTAARGLTTAGLGSPDFPLLAKQHVEYVAALRSAGAEVRILPAIDELPDSYFIEDAAVLLPGLAILTRSAIPERSAEPVRLAPTLSRWFREIVEIEAPGVLDGGDVLVSGDVVLIGLSDRTNAAGAEQLGAFLEPRGFAVRPTRVAGGIHLKSGLTAVAEQVLLAHPDYVGRPELDGFEVIEVPPEESYGANALRFNDTILVAAGYPTVEQRLAGVPGATVVALDMSEMAKMDGGLSCLSLRW